MAGTTNAQQWNPTATNQETDAQYLADSQRVAGAQNTSIFMSMTANKMFYQLSTYITALFQAFANKGYTTSDSNLNTLTAVCANFLTSADIRSGLTNVAYAPSIALALGNTTGFYITTSGNINITGVAGAATGQLVVMMYQQGNGGGAVTFPANFVGAITPDPAANAVSAQLFVVDPNGYFRAVGPLFSPNGMFFTSASFSGSVSVSGNVAAGSVTTPALQVNGNASITGLATIGGVNTGVVNASNVNASGTVTANALVSNGNASVAGALSAGSVTTNALTVNGKANVGSFQIGGTAPNGYVLIGNGATYVPTALVFPPPTLSMSGNLANTARGFGAPYTNTSGGPMYVGGYATANGYSSVNAYINGQFAWANTGPSPGYAYSLGFGFMVPAGASYQLTNNNSPATLTAWYEYTFEGGN